MVSFACSYGLKAIELAVIQATTESFALDGIFDTWFGYYLFIFNQNLIFDLLTIIVQIYFNMTHLKEIETR
jgi:hypothetical protein